MAKRRLQMEQEAKDRLAKVEILTLKCIRGLGIQIGDVRRVEDSQGRVYKQVQLLHCWAKVIGRIEPIEAEIEMEAKDGWGIGGEMDQCIMPAVVNFARIVKATVMEEARKADVPLGSVLPPLPSDRGPSKASREFASRGHAAQDAKRMGHGAESLTTPPPEQEAAGDGKGGET